MTSAPPRAPQLADRRWLQVLIVALVCARVAGIAWSARTSTHGDYYASLPGTYVQTVNPTLWTSPDMTGAMGYLLNTYYHGPTQYLTLYPVAYLDSYAAIAALLLPLYLVVLAACFWFLWQALRCLAPGVSLGVPLFAATFLFFPLLQAFLQREFEIVVALGLAFALAQLVQGRPSVAAAALAYIAWFKYIPLLFAGYLDVRGWAKAVLVFALTSTAILIATHLVFGWSEFFNNNVPSHAAQVFNVLQAGFVPDAAGVLRGTGFCNGWFETETTLANVRHGLCALAATRPWLPPHAIYLLVCAGVAVTYLASHARLNRAATLGPADEAWRRALEFSIVTTVCACFFFAHYYYLVVLVIPYGVLMTRYLVTRQWSRLLAWGLSYVLVSAFVIPIGVISQLLGIDAWAWYFRGAWFLPGELLLMALLLIEYWALARRSPVAARPGAALS